MRRVTLSGALVNADNFRRADAATKTAWLVRINTAAAAQAVLNTARPAPYIEPVIAVAVIEPV